VNAATTSPIPMAVPNDDATGVALYCNALSINDAGITIGTAQRNIGTTYNGRRVVRWDASGAVATELGSLGSGTHGFSDAYPFALNNVGTAVGQASKFVNGTALSSCAVRWEASSTAAEELQSLGANANGSSNSKANAINNSGVIVGSAERYDVTGNDLGLRATRWNAGDTAVTELNPLGTDTLGRTTSEAYSNNDSGFAVGYANRYKETGQFVGQHAVVWDPAGTAIDLNDLIDPTSGWTVLRFARSISADNWVTGVGRFNPGGGLSAYDRPFLLQVPEPTAIALALLLVPLTRRRTAAPT